MWRFFCFAEKGGLMDMEQEELMMLVPPLFSLKDIPEETVLRPSDFTNKKTKKQTVDGSLQMVWLQLTLVS
jgi:general transcription factor 3C polypeptide 5 (transcription factor C subunit 1)